MKNHLDPDQTQPTSQASRDLQEDLAWVHELVHRSQERGLEDLAMFFEKNAVNIADIRREVSGSTAPGSVSNPFIYPLR